MYSCVRDSRFPPLCHAHTHAQNTYITKTHSAGEPVSLSCCVSRYNIRGVTNRFKLCTFMFTSLSLLSSSSALLSLAPLSSLCSFIEQGRIKTVCLKEV